MSILYIVATPIGNLEDITLRALRVLREVSLVAAEDTRAARVLLGHHGIATPVVAYTDAYERQKAARTGALLAALAEGDVALISEAGTPLVADPGHDLAQRVLAAGHRLVPIPGPSAVLAALVASGLPAEPFHFVGFLPRRAADRRRRLQALAGLEATLVMLEAPHRLTDALADMVAALGPERPLTVAREITKLHEEFWRGTLAAAQAHFSAVAPRGEFTLVVGGAPPAETEGRWPEGAARELLAALAAEGLAAAAAARIAARFTHWPRQTLYGWLMHDKGDAP